MLNKVSALGLFIGMCLVLLSAPDTLAREQSVKIVVTSATVSLKGIPIYEEMARYFSSKLGWDVKIVSNLSYSEADNMLDLGVVQIGFVCGLPYVHSFAQDKYELLAIPIMSMKEDAFPDAKGYQDVPGKYYSYTIVHKDSPFTSWADLEGRSYTFSEISSNSGYNLPRAKLVSIGARDWNYFSRVVVSGSHEESIRLVAIGEVDASSVDSLVLDYDRLIGSVAALDVRIIEHLGPAGIPPVVISRQVDPSIKQPMMDVLLAMHKDPEGKEILKKALMTRFDPPADQNYDDIRSYEQAAKDAGFMDYIHRE